LEAAFFMGAAAGAVRFSAQYLRNTVG